MLACLRQQGSLTPGTAVHGQRIEPVSGLAMGSQEKLPWRTAEFLALAIWVKSDPELDFLRTDLRKIVQGTLGNEKTPRLPFLVAEGLVKG